ncbi:MAG: SusC/RagA family TonB-linked outer membrane protein [Prevotellaceae bacterium]|nr:SusC/RagA family TonB-linked outer membrane protein [Prevotellaceae bacterium]
MELRKQKILLLLVALFLFAPLTSSTAFAQRKGWTFEKEIIELPLPTVLKQLEKTSGYVFSYSVDLVSKYKITKTINVHTIEDAMSQLLEGLPLSYSVSGRFVMIVKQEKEEKSANHDGTVTLGGTVTDSDGNPLPGVSIIVGGNPIGISNDAGHFTIKVKKDNWTDVTFSFIGMNDVVYKFSAQHSEQRLVIRMNEDSNNLKEVVVNGIFERKKESFTGSATVIRKDELMRNGSKNLLENLRNIDPSFKIVENMDLGSDPNTMPQIQMRGQQSIASLDGTYNGNPNQPLFILDGFEADMTTVYDLDMNRVETVVLLKDAAAKAIYGSKAANGVVVIETRKPEAGKLRITYKGDLNLTIPDLTGYNLCNAQEKFEVDKAHGEYADPWFWEQYLNSIQAQIAKGVNTDWLAQPLRTGVGHRHSVYMEGGDNRLRYGVDLLYNDISGVMKGSDRKTFTGGFTLSYRYKNLMFRNQFNTTLNRSDDSPYGSFSDYVELNPYWSPYDEQGNIKQIAGSTGGGGLVGITKGNPLWNATIGTKNFSKYTSLTDNLYVEWQVLPTLKLMGRLGLSKTENNREDFYPASHTMFLDYSDDRFFEKGSYSKLNGESSSFTADITANYSLQIKKHGIYLNAGWNAQENRSKSVSFKVIGFPNDRIDFITSGLEPDPNNPFYGYESVSRSVSVLGAMNYSYDDRFLADFSYRGSASSLFGKSNRWGQFWSAGIGWNLHKEHFMKGVTWLNQLKLRASMGYTGSQNFNAYQSLATFNYYLSQAYDHWVGSYLMALPNDELKWQKTKDYNAGFDMILFNRVNMRFDWYIQRTDDQLLSLTIPPSMGFTSYKENLGSTENKGLEFKINTHIIQDVQHDKYLSAFFSIARNKNTLKKISNALKSYNDEVDKELEQGKQNKPQVHYIEGQSMNAIWAVRSLGIDPATGDEIFLTKDGNITTEWNVADQVVCGDAMPKCTGTFGLNMDYRGIFCNLSFYYQFGGQVYNQTLVDRVENADVRLNVDKRIYNAVWKQPGDVVDFAYKAYKTTKPSSRFVQDLNELQFSTLNVGYDFKHCTFIKRWGLQQLKASFYMNDIFRASTVEIERGLTYPFARTYSLSLQATF